MSVIAVLLFVAVTSYGNNLGKAPIQLNKDKICVVFFVSYVYLEKNKVVIHNLNLKND